MKIAGASNARTDPEIAIFILMFIFIELNLIEPEYHRHEMFNDWH